MKVVILQGKKKSQLIFFYDPKITEVIKSIKGWSFDIECKKWYIPLEGSEAILQKFEKEKIETIQLIEPLAKKPLGEVNSNNVRVTKCGSHYKVNLPISLVAYNALRNIPNIIFENNSWIIKGESIQEFFNACKSNNIKIE